MTTIPRFLLLFLLAPVFAVAVQAAGSLQSDFRILDSGFRTDSFILDSGEAANCNYDSSDALLHQRRSLYGKNADGEGLGQYGETEASTESHLAYSLSAEFVAARTPGSFITNTRLEVQALQRQGLSRSDAFAQIRRFNAGNADGYLFHFTSQKGARGIVSEGVINPSARGVWGPGVYSGTTPTPGPFLKNVPFAGWGLGGKGVNVRIPFQTTQPSVTPWLPPKTRVFRESVPLGGGN